MLMLYVQFSVHSHPYNLVGALEWFYVTRETIFIMQLVVCRIIVKYTLKNTKESMYSSS